MARTVLQWEIYITLNCSSLLSITFGQKSLCINRRVANANMRCMTIILKTEQYKHFYVN